MLTISLLYPLSCCSQSANISPIFCAWPDNRLLYASWRIYNLSAHDGSRNNCSDSCAHTDQSFYIFYCHIFLHIFTLNVQYGYKKAPSYGALPFVIFLIFYVRQKCPFIRKVRKWSQNLDCSANSFIQTSVYNVSTSSQTLLLVAMCKKSIFYVYD